MDSQLPRKGTPARTDADDCFDDSRHLRRTLASNGKKAPAVEESLRRASRVARRALSGKALVRIPSPPGRCPLAPPPKRKCQLPTAPPLMLCLGLRARASRVFALSRWTTTDSAGPDCWILAMRKYARWPGLPTTAEHTLATGSRAKQPGGRREWYRRAPAAECAGIALLQWSGRSRRPEAGPTLASAGPRRDHPGGGLPRRQGDRPVRGALRSSATSRQPAEPEVRVAHRMQMSGCALVSGGGPRRHHGLWEALGGQSWRGSAKLS